MQSDRHHSRMYRALFPKRVIAPLKIVEEIGGRSNARRHAELGVVISHRIVNNEVLLRVDLNIIWEVVVIDVRVVDEPSFLDQELACMDRGP